MAGSIPLLSYFMALVLTLGTVCCPLLGLARLMEAGRVHEARRARLQAAQKARRRDAEMKLAAVKRSIARKFAASAIGGAADGA